jgi:hypothetical protein
MFWYNFEKSFINNFEKMLTAWQKLTIIAKYFPIDALNLFW